MTHTGTMSRRERLRIETTAEIKRIACELLAGGGPGAISLRAIARQLGMAPNSVYGYFATRDDLVTALINDVYNSLADSLDAAIDSAPADNPNARVRAWGNAYRTWSLANPEGFRLVFFDPVPGYAAPEGGPAPEAVLRLCTGVNSLAAAAWPHSARRHEPQRFTWSDFEPTLVESIRSTFPDLPPDGLALGLHIWSSLHGPVTLEICGMLSAQKTNMDRVFDSELTLLERSLGPTSDS